MAVEYEISSDVATIKGVAPNTQVARVASLYSGQITYDDEAGSKFATATIDGKSQRVMLCIAVNGTVNYDDVPCLYSTVDGHRCLNIVSPTETGTPDDVPSVNETVVIDGKNVRAVRCILINATPVYDGVSSVCTFVENGKTHTAQLVNKITGGAIEMVVRGTSPLSLPDAIANSLEYLKAFGGTKQGLPNGYTQLEYIESTRTQYIDTGVGLNAANKITGKISFVTLKNLAYIAGGRISGGMAIGYALYAASHSGFTIYNTSWPEQGIDVSANQILEFETVMKSGQQSFIVNGNTIVTGDRTISLDSSNIYLFGLKTEYMAAAKVYSLKIYDNDTLVRNFIPAKRNSDNAIGMYDTVSQTFFTNQGTGTFTAGPTAVPTPDTPMDIVSNNGVLKVSPNLFHLNEEIRKGVNLTINSDGAYVLNGTAQGASLFSIQNITLSAGTYQFVLIDKTIINTLGSHIQVLSESGGINVVINMNSSDTLRTFTVSETLSDMSVRLRISQDTVYDNLVIKPMLVKSDVAPTTYIPYGSIYTDGTVETINVHGKNLFDGQWQQGIYSTTSGSYTPNVNNRICNTNIIQVKPSTNYTVSCPDYALAGGMRWLFYDANKNFISAVVSGVTTVTTPSNAKYINFYIANNLTVGTAPDLQIERGSTATDYVPYYDGGTATAEMLLKVGDYEDVQSIIDGVVTRNVGVKVLDGTEDWGSLDEVGGAHRTSIVLADGAEVSGRTNVPITHFKFSSSENVEGIGFYAAYQKLYIYPQVSITTLAQFKQWLADQYAAGTPVTIIYPLATPTTESVAGQALQVQQGDNVVEITQAAIDGLELEVKYQAAVSLTIQEVQDANLDPNVQVTIN